MCTDCNLTLHFAFQNSCDVVSHYECIQSRTGEVPNMLLEWTRCTLTVYVFRPYLGPHRSYLKTDKGTRRSCVLTLPLIIDAQIPWTGRHQVFFFIMPLSTNSTRNMTRGISQSHQRHAVSYVLKAHNVSLSNRSKSCLPTSIHFRIRLLTASTEVTIEMWRNWITSSVRDTRTILVWYCMHRASSCNMYINQQYSQNSCN